MTNTLRFLPIHIDVARNATDDFNPFHYKNRWHRIAETFPCALLSCALLERAWQRRHDFEREPMVYKSHNISIDRDYLAQLRSNDVLHLLSRHADPVAKTPVYDCFGTIGSERPLFSARIELMPLAGQPRWW